MGELMSKVAVTFWWFMATLVGWLAIATLNRWVFYKVQHPSHEFAAIFAGVAALVVVVMALVNRYDLRRLGAWNLIGAGVTIFFYAPLLNGFVIVVGIIAGVILAGLGLYRLIEYAKAEAPTKSRVQPPPRPRRPNRAF